MEKLLEDDVKAGRLALAVRDGRTMIELQPGRQFAPGRARVEPPLRALLERVARALKAAPGRITVVGHTDDLPIRSKQFASNEALSLRRAQAALRVIARTVTDADRLRAEGRGAREPVVPNDDAAGRARNRRVSIEIEAKP